jgi:hypothetical protein
VLRAGGEADCIEQRIRVAKKGDRLSSSNSADTLGTKAALEEDISVHVLTTSATMVGVCLTVIGLFKLILQLKTVATWADDLLFIDALLFLLTCGLAYWAVRTRSIKRRHRAERIADVLFLVALTLMTIICALVTYTLV